MQPVQTKVEKAKPVHSSLRVDYESEIASLKKKLNAVILAHYYQDDDIQDLADHVGDSLELARRAAETTADVIVFCCRCHCVLRRPLYGGGRQDSESRQAGLDS